MSTRTQYVQALKHLLSESDHFIIIQTPQHDLEAMLETPTASRIVVAALTTLAFALRFYKINQPDQVVYVLNRSPLSYIFTY